MKRLILTSVIVLMTIFGFGQNTKIIKGILIGDNLNQNVRIVCTLDELISDTSDFNYKKLKSNFKKDFKFEYTFVDVVSYEQCGLNPFFTVTKKLDYFFLFNDFHSLRKQGISEVNAIIESDLIEIDVVMKNGNKIKYLFQTNKKVIIKNHCMISF